MTCDKALAEIEGAPILVHIIQRISPVVDEVLLVTNTEDRRKRYSAALRSPGVTVRTLLDDASASKGPLLGIKTGLKVAKAQYCLVLPCDTPFVNPQVVDAMFENAYRHDASVPIWPDRQIEPLAAVYKRKPAFQFAEILNGMGRQRPDDLVRAGSRIRFVSTVKDVRKYDPEYVTFININYPSDFSSPRSPRVQPGPIRESFTLEVPALGEAELKEISEAETQGKTAPLEFAANLDCIAEALYSRKAFFWAAIAFERCYKTLLSASTEGRSHGAGGRLLPRVRKSLVGAVRSYRREAERYQERRIRQLAVHAGMDGSWCADRLGEVKAREAPGRDFSLST